MYSHFIDVSKWQRTDRINWAKVAETQVFCILKATEGVDFIDSSLDAKVKKCREHNIPFGLYHFARPDRKNGGFRGDARAEANDFCDALDKYPDYTVRPVLDLEYEETPLSRSELTEWCEIFADVIKQRTGRDIIMYGNYYYLRDKLAATHNLGRFPLWLAQYNKRDQPNRIPNTWKTWSMWQYSDTWTDHDLYPGPLDANWIKNEDLVCV